MNADAFRHFYAYHFAENRNLWDRYVMQLSLEQFSRPSAYSHGSVRDQIIHLINTDNGWFSDLRGAAFRESPQLTGPDDRATIRTYWDAVEQDMHLYLDALQDDMLTTKPLSGEDEELILWQVLLHVANHGTDHRAQILRLLNDLGLETTSQDYIFYTYNHANDN
jgi:uncharacterized damage-inducible protein DinB